MVEVKLGMVESKDVFKVLQNDPMRWNFAYAKIAGLWLAILASAGFWGDRHRKGRWWDLRDICWAPLLLGLAIFGGLGSLPALWDGQQEPTVDTTLEILVGLITLPGLLLVVGGLFGDPMPRARTLVLRSWPYLLLIVVLVAIGFGPAAWVHQQNHVWAMGLAPFPLWASWFGIHCWSGSLPVSPERPSRWIMDYLARIRSAAVRNPLTNRA